ncbi:hypothetical protein SDC9_108598 [bioreactor metagenome]|uniref:Uncharacterized protein n=1 Tax=bioreactor metagenome TaxID=1076179 RepID=A0A645B9N4_9ZZZZ
MLFGGDGYMIFKILSILMILLGISGLFLSIREHDKNVMNKYKTMKFFLDIMMFIFYIITGLLLLFEMISGEYIVFVVVIFCILNMLIERKIKINDKEK